jgi:hypothetical protein
MTDRKPKRRRKPAKVAEKPKPKPVKGDPDKAGLLCWLRNAALVVTVEIR